MIDQLARFESQCPADTGRQVLLWLRLCLQFCVDAVQVLETVRH